ncbi:hypothetical protein C1I98_32790 [Spongiactinospora gelatinilytica]|uniref:VCBS repeat-containing protein n=1 Tax=Spongiactinospora gelatinilytica TaxID=2666298 RepID=A0A2W2FV38_9ACTN|nr:hypothetical protein [Spongiactinospora gelatinilytica]PZG28438.1 hypothetical protein C1I98_32790 [Spongiactinospora gelatinilytica]
MAVLVAGTQPSGQRMCEQKYDGIAGVHAKDGTLKIVPPTQIRFADVTGGGRDDYLLIGWTGVTHAWLNRLPPSYFKTFHP